MEYLKQAAACPVGETEERGKHVAEIIHNIRTIGDAALIEYNTRFDGNTRTAFRVTQEEIDSAYAKMSWMICTGPQSTSAGLRRHRRAA